MNLIAAVDADWGLGRQGELLIRISEDMKQFRQRTMGGVIVLGRKTLLTFPQAEPLPGRDNIILTTDRSFSCAGAQSAHSLEELFALLQQYDKKRKIWVVGGAQVYRQLLPYCDKAFITHLEGKLEPDCWLPALEMPDWLMIERSSYYYHQDTGAEYFFAVYRNEHPLPWRTAK